MGSVGQPDAVVAEVAAAAALDCQVSADAAVVDELGVTELESETEAETDVYFLEHLEERPVEKETAAT